MCMTNRHRNTRTRLRNHSCNCTTKNTPERSLRSIPQTRGNTQREKQTKPKSLFLRAQPLRASCVAFLPSLLAFVEPLFLSTLHARHSSACPTEPNRFYDAKTGYTPPKRTRRKSRQVDAVDRNSQSILAPIYPIGPPHTTLSLKKAIGPKGTDPLGKRHHRAPDS